MGVIFSLVPRSHRVAAFNDPLSRFRPLLIRHSKSYKFLFMVVLAVHPAADRMVDPLLE